MQKGYGGPAAVPFVCVSVEGHHHAARRLPALALTTAVIRPDAAGWACRPYTLARCGES